MSNPGTAFWSFCAFAAVRLLLLAVATVAVIQFNDGYLKLLARWSVRHVARRQSSIQELEALFALPDPRETKRYSEPERIRRSSAAAPTPAVLNSTREIFPSKDPHR